MTKRELIDALKNYPNDAEIVIWEWTKDGSKYYFTNPTCQNDPSKDNTKFAIHAAFELTKEIVGTK
jgi:YHS domain-containing protein